MKPIISFVLRLVGGFTTTFLLCIIVMAAVYGIDPEVGKKVKGVNRAEYQRWVSETVIPRMVWISCAGAVFWGAFGVIRDFRKRK
jgi:hypothetical protein